MVLRSPWTVSQSYAPTTSHSDDRTCYGHDFTISHFAYLLFVWRTEAKGTGFIAHGIGRNSIDKLLDARKQRRKKGELVWISIGVLLFGWLTLSLHGINEFYSLVLVVFLWTYFMVWDQIKYRLYGIGIFKLSSVREIND